MSEPLEDIAMCAHMRVRHKKVLLDATESGRISDSWVCEDCGTLFIPEAANREKDVLIERLRAIVRADDERLRNASYRVGMSPMGCDTADSLAEEILSLRASVDGQRATTNLGGPAMNRTRAVEAIRRVRRDTYTTVIEVREKEGL